MDRHYCAAGLPLVTWAGSHGRVCRGHNPIIFTILIFHAREQRCLASSVIGADWNCNIMTWLVSVNLVPQFQIMEK